MDAKDPYHIPSPSELRAAYDKAIAAFTLDDLAKYLKPEPGIPFEDVIAELEAIQREHDEKQTMQ